MNILYIIILQKKYVIRMSLRFSLWLLLFMSNSGATAIEALFKFSRVRGVMLANVCKINKASSLVGT